MSDRMKHVANTVKGARVRINRDDPRGGAGPYYNKVRAPEYCIDAPNGTVYSSGEGLEYPMAEGFRNGAPFGRKLFGGNRTGE